MKYVALGDSITAFRAGVKVYFEFLQELQEEFPFTEMINSGVGGWKTSDLLAHLDNKCLQYHPGLVTIMLGTNDHAVYKGKTEPDVSLAAYETNLRQIVQKIRDNGSIQAAPAEAPSVILMTPPFVATYMNVADTDVNQSRLLEYCHIVEKLSNELQTGFVDINSITGNGTDWDDQVFFEQFTADEDGCHLNTKGHSLIVPAIRAAIKEQLS
ncbi:SGNH/GDSL hydrolase family protein [Paenibacillus eucommiae]|uniref:Lysophospholipase L1-like esterase n=1 Tax=Paenibacillus eucommiae TaxID=1355755 RepID=A0ABS4J0W3_9BACL|nr:SGNH/GDSL hydrolase family protein [Paenibacillus eucommiae]MBP1993468.1 lysophospholipase L1-like esterase [Paenibacillus eucommiae]